MVAHFFEHMTLVGRVVTAGFDWGERRFLTP